MNEFDDLFENNCDKTGKPEKESKPFDKDAWIEKKRQERADAYELLDKATGEIARDGEKFRDYLNTQSRFDRYSVSNAILIACQHPGATKVADFKTWGENGASVKKGEKAMIILEPGNGYTRDDGSTAFSINVKKVFDISQTTDADREAARKVPDARTAIKALINLTECKITMVESLKAGSARYFPDKNTIYIVRGLEADEIFRALTREITVAKYSERGVDRSACDFAAHCSSYVLCERYGFDTGGFSFDNVSKRYEGMDNKAIRKELGDMRSAANELSQQLNMWIDEMDKSKSARTGGAR